MNIRIDPEFRDCLDPLDEKARQTLEESLQAEGCRDALVVWPQPDGDPILLDGHNRHEICGRLGIVFRTVNCPDTVVDRPGAAGWIIKNQQGRRNMTADRLAYLCGKVFNSEKREWGGTGANKHTAEQRCQNDTSAQKEKTAKRVAREFGLSERTVTRHGKFADQVDAIAAKHGPEAKAEILAGRKEVSDFMPELAPPVKKAIPVSAPEPKTSSTPSVGELSAADPAQEEEEDVVPKPEIASEPASASGVKPPDKDIRDMTESECVQWLARNMEFPTDCGARPGPVHIADAVSDNLADPEAARRHDDSAMKHICQLDHHVALLPSAIERDKPDVERREMYKKRLARHVDALQTLIASL